MLHNKRDLKNITTKLSGPCLDSDLNKTSKVSL